MAKLFLLIIFGIGSLSYKIGAADNLDRQRAECTGTAKRWDENLNRCIWTQQTYETRESSSQCREAQDQKACFERVASETTGVKKGERNKKTKDSRLGSTLAAAYSIFLYTAKKAKKLKVPQCPSQKIFMGTSLVWLAGDQYLKSNTKKKFKNLISRYEEQTQNWEKKGPSQDSSFESQYSAFSYLRDEQGVIKKNADQRVKLHQVAKVGYGAALASALVELIWTGCRGENENTTTADEKPASTVADEKPASTVADEKPASKLGSSAQIAASSGLMLIFNEKLAKGAREEKKRAKDNIKNIEEIMSNFKISMTGFCSDGREDLSNLRCYCYTESGQPNPQRTNSSLCQKEWEETGPIDRHLPPNTYATPDDPNKPQGCLDMRGQYDEECRCRSMKHTKTGEDACYKIPLNKNDFSGPGAFWGGVPEVASLLNDFSQGADGALGKLNYSSWNQKAHQQKGLNKKRLAQLKKKIHAWPFSGKPGKSCLLSSWPRFPKAFLVRIFRASFPTDEEGRGIWEERPLPLLPISINLCLLPVTPRKKGKFL